MAQLRLDRVLADVEVGTQLSIRHPRREQRQEFALTLGQAGVSTGPAHSLVYPCVLRSLGQDDAVAPRSGLQPVDDLLPGHRFGDESLRARIDGVAHGPGLVREAEHHDGAVAGIGAEEAHALAECVCLSVGVEQGDVDRPLRPPA